MAGHGGYHGIRTGRLAAHRPGHFLAGANIDLLRGHIFVQAGSVVVVVALCQRKVHVSVCGEDVLLVLSDGDSTGDVHGPEWIHYDRSLPCRSCFRNRHYHRGSQGGLWYVQKFGRKTLPTGWR